MPCFKFETSNKQPIPDRLPEWLECNPMYLNGWVGERWNKELISMIPNLFILIRHLSKDRDSAWLSSLPICFESRTHVGTQKDMEMFWINVASWNWAWVKKKMTQNGDNGEFFFSHLGTKDHGAAFKYNKLKWKLRKNLKKTPQF